MRTYLLDILHRYNRFSENLDVKAILCNKSWLVFNDSGEKELYIFQENGSLITSVNGNVANATWQYISANQSLVISLGEQSYMLHPLFIDNTIFALQQDGTERFAFMINERQSKSFYPKSLQELNAYFEGIERKRMETKQQKERMLLEQQRELERIEIKQQEKIQEGETRRLEEKAILAASTQYKRTKILCHIIGLLGAFLITLFVSRCASDEGKAILAWFLMLPLLYFYFLMLLYIFIISPTREKVISRKNVK